MNCVAESLLFKLLWQMYREMLVKEKETITRRNQEDASIMNLYNKYTFGINLRVGSKIR